MITSGRPTVDTGPAPDYWKRYYTPQEVDEILTNSVVGSFVSGGIPIHVRLYPQPRPAPTVLMSHGLLPYGLMLARLQLPFFRAGFNVVQWDLPGFGFSGGPRGGCTIPQIIDTWKDALGFAHRRFGEPIFTVGFAEDGVTCYYAHANNPLVRAMTVHVFTEYGDPDNVHWQGPPWLVRLKTLAAALIAAVRPTLAIPAEQAIPWDDVFGHPGATTFRTTFESDPLRVRAFEFRLVYSMLRRMRPAVPFEECWTPIQLIASELSEIWPYRMNLKYFDRLGVDKELVTLWGKPHWEFNRDFDERFCAYSISWFDRHAARVVGPVQSQTARG